MSSKGGADPVANDPEIAYQYQSNPFLVGTNALAKIFAHQVGGALSAGRETIDAYQNGDLETAGRNLALLSLGSGIGLAPRIGGVEVPARSAIAELSKPKPDDFVYAPNGTVDWGRMKPQAVADTGGALQDLPFRVTRGKDDYGVEHLADERHGRVQEMGFDDLRQYLDYVVQNHNVVLGQPGKEAISLVVSPGRGFERNKPAHNFMAVTLQPKEGYYGLTSIFPNAAESYLKSGGKYEIWRQGAYPASPSRQ